MAGRALVQTYHAALVAVEGVVNAHSRAWQAGEATPLRVELDTRYARWLALAVGDRLALEWPVSPLPAVAATTIADPPTRTRRVGRGRPSASRIA